MLINFACDRSKLDSVITTISMLFSAENTSKCSSFVVSLFRPLILWAATYSYSSGWFCDVALVSWMLSLSVILWFMFTFWVVTGSMLSRRMSYFKVKMSRCSCKNSSISILSVFRDPALVEQVELCELWILLETLAALFRSTTSCIVVLWLPYQR